MAKKEINLTAPVYTTEGKKEGTITLPESVFAVRWNADLVHQVVIGMQANARQPWAHTKDRSEVSGGGRKPWKQKGTGRARHGSSRSPIWRKGGVTFGPRNERSYEVKINRKMRVAALMAVLSKKYAAGEIVFVKDLSLATPKTADARVMLNNLGKIEGASMIAERRNNANYIVLPKQDVATKKSFQNMGNVLVGTLSTLNPVDVLSYKYLIIAAPEAAVEALTAKLAK
jgi:large subunit ribosomal protein L4